MREKFWTKVRWGKKVMSIKVRDFTKLSVLTKSKRWGKSRKVEGKGKCGNASFIHQKNEFNAGWDWMIKFSQ